jgi:hypothetical protein
MKKFTLAGLAAIALFVVAPAFGDPIVAVPDPTPNGMFSGNYVVSNDDPSTPQNEYKEGSQTGYVGVYGDTSDPTSFAVVACNGNPSITRPDDGSPLQGYIWIGPSQAASNPTEAAPGNVAGAGNNNADADGNPTGNSPCPDANPSGPAG